MIIDIGNGVDESVVKWKYNDKDKWRDADIDELIHLYESVVHCKDCHHWNSEFKGCKRNPSVEAWHETDFCSYGERREE